MVITNFPINFRIIVNTILNIVCKIIVNIIHCPVGIQEYLRCPVLQPDGIIFITSLRVSDGDTGLELDNDAIRHTFFGGLVGIGLMLVADGYSWDFFHQTTQREQLVVKDTITVDKDVNGVAAAFSPIPVEKMKLQTKEVVKRKALNQLGDLKTKTFGLGSHRSMLRRMCWLMPPPVMFISSQK